MSKDVFISYKSSEFEEANRIKAILEENGVSCWMAPASIPLGSNYASEIPNAIANCKIFLILLSKKSQKSKWVAKELDRAINCGKVVIPLMLEKCKLHTPFNFYLTDVQRYEAFLNSETAIRDMVYSVKAVLSGNRNNGNTKNVLEKKKISFFKKIAHKKQESVCEELTPVNLPTGFHIPQGQPVEKSVQSAVNAPIPSPPVSVETEPVRRFKAGDVLESRYEIIKEIGEGGSAEVYLAKDTALDILVAVKCMRSKNFIDYEHAKKALKREFEIQKKCIHNGFSIIRDSIEKDTEFVIIMDYIEGKSLNKMIEEQGRLSEKDVVSVGIQICDVLHYLHTREDPLYFRDTKPSNIMIRPNGEAVLIDFGTAVQETELTLEDTTALGTYGYAAPEQHAQKIDARTDVYNLGATLYHAITGLNPADPPYEFLPVREVVPEVSEEMEKIIAKSVERNPLKRYQSMVEFKNDLQAIKFA